jgi:hypothetical protein
MMGSLTPGIFFSRHRDVWRLDAAEAITLIAHRPELDGSRLRRPCSVFVRTL